MCMDDRFWAQVTEEPTKQCALLDLILISREELVREAMLVSSLGCSDHEIVKFRILRGRSRAKRVGPQPWISTSLKTLLEESLEIQS